MGLARKPAHCSTVLPPAVIIQTLGNVSGASGQETGRRRDNSNKTLYLKKKSRGKGSTASEKKGCFAESAAKTIMGK